MVLSDFYAFVQNFDLNLIRQMNSTPVSAQEFTQTFEISHENAVKFLPLILILSWYWFLKSPQQLANRAKVVEAFVFSFVATVIARICALTLPFRHRPFTLEELHYNALPYENLRTWSSFPSDHAVLGFALAASIFRVSPILGVVSCLHVTCVICLPRLFLGLHYPTDLIGGALIGMSFIAFIAHLKTKDVITHRILKIEQNYPQYFYVASLIVMYEFIEMFEFTRGMVAQLFAKLHILTH